MILEINTTGILILTGIVLMLMIYYLFKKPRVKPEGDKKKANTKIRAPFTIVEKRSFGVGVEYTVLGIGDKYYGLKMEVDEFNGDKTIKLTRYCDYLYDKLMLTCDGGLLIYLNIGIEFKNGNNYLMFATYQKDLKFKKGDNVKLLFEDNQVYDFPLLENGYKVDKDGSGILIESYSEISPGVLNDIQNKYLRKWRFTPEKEPDQHITGTLDPKQSETFRGIIKAYLIIVESENLINKVSATDKQTEQTNCN